MCIREGHRGSRNVSQSGSNEQGEDQRFKGIFRLKSGIHAVSAKSSDLKKKKKGLH